MQSTSLQDYLQQLASEGERESSGFFTLSAQRVGQRYRTLLEQEPALPWLRWMQFCYNLRARRYLCRMSRGEYRLSLLGLTSTAEVAEAVQGYPEPPTGRAALLHEVLWLFLAQEPRSIELCLPGWRLTIYPDRFERERHDRKLEEDVSLRVVLPSGPLHWLSQLAQRLRIHASLSRRAAFFPGALEWDGLSLTRPELIQPARLVLATAVDRERGRFVEHFACAEPACFRPRLLCLNGQRLIDLPGDRYQARWLSLENGPEGSSLEGTGGLAVQTWQDRPVFLEGSEDHSLSGGRLRARLLLCYRPEEGPAQLLPVMDGVALNPLRLPGWPPGVQLIAACPDDLKTDFSGLQLVQDDTLQQWLGHLRARYARTVAELAVAFPSSGRELFSLGDRFQ